MNESSELEQLRELIVSFPDKYSVEEVEEANRIARIRFDVLDNEVIPRLADAIKIGGISFDIDSCFVMCEFFHETIFEDIISINGEFRKRNHKGSARIYFGGQKHQEMRSRFSGAPPDKIQECLTEAFEHLVQSESNTPVDNALRFYQKFVFTHPFYDGNGRIARLFVNLHLYKYGKFIDWKNLQDKGAFLKKLNTYHESGLERHFKWWAGVCYKFIYDISEEDAK